MEGDNTHPSPYRGGGGGGRDSILSHGQTRISAVNGQGISISYFLRPEAKLRLPHRHVHNEKINFNKYFTEKIQNKIIMITSLELK